MFVLTLNRRLLKRVALAAGCGVVLAGAVFALDGHFNRDTAQTASVQPAASTHMESTQDMASFFTAYGLEMDPATVTMDKVKVPRSWDESFTAFNAEIEKCGLSLQNYKGKTVEKWMMLSPSASAGDQKTYGVMLIVCFLFCTPLPWKLYQKYGRSLLVTVGLAAVFWLSVYLLHQGLNDPFMYFRF